MSLLSHIDTDSPNSNRTLVYTPGSELNETRSTNGLDESSEALSEPDTGAVREALEMILERLAAIRAELAAIRAELE